MSSALSESSSIFSLGSEDELEVDAESASTKFSPWENLFLVGDFSCVCPSFKLAAEILLTALSEEDMAAYFCLVVSLLNCPRIELFLNFFPNLKMN